MNELLLANLEHQNTDKIIRMGDTSKYKKLNESIREIPLKLALHMREYFDGKNCVDNCKKLIELLPKNRFKLRLNELEFCRSATDEIITKLGSQNFLVNDLLKLLDDLRFEELVEELRYFVGIPIELVTIRQQPRSSVELEAGEDLVLKVDAQGFPYPRYQWFVEDDEVDNGKESLLIKKNMKVEDAGTYCCRIHNYPDPRKCIFTDPTIVTVRPSPAPMIQGHTLSHTLFSKDILKLFCKASSFVDSKLVYEWYKDDVFLAPGSSLEKECLTKDDCGEYKCIVRNDFGFAVTQPILINILVETLEIVVQPKSSSLEPGKRVLLTCNARGPKPIFYQWYKDENRIQGATSPELDITINSRTDTGIYFCKASSPRFQMECRSDFAILKIKENPKQLQKKYVATDKVALLIGNEDYRSEKKLTASQNDVEILCSIFMELNFKVVSLINLTQNEMESAVGRFVEMLDKGVYGVFYYAGHGFEVDGDPYSYLIPVDAPTGCNIKSCLQAEKIQELMAAKNPAVCCLILDICRIVQQNKAHYSRTISVPENSVYFYATTRGSYAYENPNEKIGRLVKHLREFLYLEEGIERVFGKVRDDFGNSNSGKNKQVPEMKTNLIGVERSLTDPINYTNHTVEYTRREIAWSAAHTLPESQRIEIPSINVVLNVEFLHNFSNVLIIYVTIVDPGNTINCHAWAARFPSVLSADKPSIIQDNNKKTKVVMRDLQKLKEPMDIVIKIVYEDGISPEQKNLERRIKMGYPLVANQQLWKKCTLFMDPEPSEQESIQSIEQISLE